MTYRITTNGRVFRVEANHGDGVWYPEPQIQPTLEMAKAQYDQLMHDRGGPWEPVPLKQAEDHVEREARARAVRQRTVQG